MEKGEGEHEEGEQIEAIKAMEGDNCELGGGYSQAREVGIFLEIKYI